MKKGFLNSNAKPLYPKGSEEGILPENAGDPLGYLPKSLRQSCKVRGTARLPEAKPCPSPPPCVPSVWELESLFEWVGSCSARGLKLFWCSFFCRGPWSRPGRLQWFGFGTKAGQGGLAPCQAFA